MGRRALAGPFAAVLLGCLVWWSVDAAVLSALPEVEKAEVHLNAARGVFLVDDQPFTGRAIGRFADGSVETVDEYRQGRRHGERLRYYPSGALAQRSAYFDGRLHGTTTTWFRTGIMRSEGTWREGVAEGTHRQWYESGARFKERHLAGGLEQGMQKAWRENGPIYNNYEARDGRIYGLRRSKLCVDVDEEAVPRAR